MGPKGFSTAKDSPIVQVGYPTLSPGAVIAAIQCLMDGRVSEGPLVMQAEEALARLMGSKTAILFNSGHSALVCALTALRINRDMKRVLTTPITFISTVAAAIQAGLKVVCTDVQHGTFLMDAAQAEEYMDQYHTSTIYLPVHLLGYEAPGLQRAHATVEDACEAFGSTNARGEYLGRHGDVGCFSFYTSHVLGCGELGLAITDDPELAALMRRIKDQGRTKLRIPPEGDGPLTAYDHSLVGYNMRTTDLQAALLLGNLPFLEQIVRQRQANVRQLNEGLKGLALTLPTESTRVSHLCYPITCKNSITRNYLMENLARQGIETRPLMTLIPESEAMTGMVETPWGYWDAKDIHDRTFYISCHDQLTPNKINLMAGKIASLMSGQIEGGP